ncbi:MAG: hypothetical protein AAGC84_01670 [Pseudomonas sp.]
MAQFTLHYKYDSEPRTHVLDLNQAQLSQAEAIRHLIELHHGDAENGLLMPDAEASEAELLEQADVLKIAEVRVNPHP